MLILQALRLQGFMDLTYEADTSTTAADGASKGLGSGAAPTAGHASPLPASLAVGMNGNVSASPAVGGTNGTPRGGGSQSQQQVVGGSSGSHGKLLQPKRLVQRPTVGSMGSEDVLLHACRVLPSSSNTEGPLGSGVLAGGSDSHPGMFVGELWPCRVQLADHHGCCNGHVAGLTGVPYIAIPQGGNL
jgi:hypothetical protein